MRNFLLFIERKTTALNTSCQKIQEPWLSALRLGAKLCDGCEIPSSSRVVDIVRYCWHHGFVGIMGLSASWVCRHHGFVGIMGYCWHRGLLLRVSHTEIILNFFMELTVTGANYIPEPSTSTK